MTGDAVEPTGRDQLVMFKRAAQKANATLYLHVAQLQIDVTGDEDSPAVTWRKLSDYFERSTLMTSCSSESSISGVKCRRERQSWNISRRWVR